MFIYSRVVRSVVGRPSTSSRLEKERYSGTIDYCSSVSSPDRRLQTTSAPESLSLDVVGRWTAQQVHDWAIHDVSLKPEHARKLFDNEVTGVNLLKATEETFRACAIPVGPAQTLFLALEKLKSAEAMSQDPMQLMWTALLNGEYDELDGGVVKLRGNLCWLTDEESTLFVRDCHRGLFEVVQRLYQSPLPKGKRGVVISGNPGIGKSWFLSYCLLRFAQQKKTVFFHSVERNEGWLFDRDGSVTLVANMSSLGASSLPAAARKPTSIYLFDPCGDTPKEPFRLSAFTIVAASPNNQHYKQFYKRVRQMYYMPIWSWEELLRAAPYLPASCKDEAILRARFDKFGGILRFLVDSGSSSDKDLHDAISKCVARDLELSLGALEMMESVSNKILHYEVTPEFQKSKVLFASDYVAERVFAVLLARGKADLVHFLRFAKDEPKLATLRGYLFEKYAHALLRAGGQFRVRQLSNGTETLLTVPALRLVEFSELEPCLVDGTFALPKSNNFATFDAFATFGNTIALQHTVSHDHSLNLTGITNALKVIKTRPLQVYFCVPPDVYCEFNKQPITVPTLDRKQKLTEEQLKVAKKKQAEALREAEEQIVQNALCVPWSQE